MDIVVMVLETGLSGLDLNARDSLGKTAWDHLEERRLGR